MREKKEGIVGEDKGEKENINP